MVTKKFLLSLVVLIGVSAADLGVADQAAAGELFELSRAQLDHVTAGTHRGGFIDITLKRGTTESAPSPETGDEVIVGFEPGDPGQIIELSVGTTGTERSSHGGYVITEVNHFPSR